MGGAVVFAGQLLPLLRFPLDFDYIHASRYGDGDARRATSTGACRRRRAVRGRTVLVLDDILDDGDTMAAIRERLLELGAQRVLLRGAGGEDARQRRSRSRADFVGLTIPDRFVFGCGMDAKGYWRNLPEIRAMKEADAMLAIIGGSGLIAARQPGGHRGARSRARPTASPRARSPSAASAAATSCSSRATATATPSRRTR